MLKITAVVSLVLIVTWSQAASNRQKRDDTGIFGEGSGLLASGLSCESCGRECASACGTRHFRACCFNYLRKKRGDTVKLWSTKFHDNAKVGRKPPVLNTDNMADLQFLSSVYSTNDFEPNTIDDTAENRYQIFYDA